jgi:hypothetical protein
MRAAHVVLFLSVTAGLALTAPACVRQGPPVVAPVDTAEVGDAAPVVPLTVGAMPPPGRDQCTARLRAAPIKTNEGCQLDERISKNNGVLVFPCSGTGELEAVFGEHHFRGTISAGGAPASTAGSGTLQLTLDTELDWDDGCHWETQQAIRGEWRREGKHPKLVWTYDEHPVRGTGCFGACKARADIEIDELAQ